MSGDLGEHWKRVARGRDFRLQVVTRGDRERAIDLAKEAIAAHRGDVLDFRMFSNLSLCLIVEMTGDGVSALAKDLESLGWIVEADPDRSALGRRGGELLEGTVQLTFSAGDGELEIPTPSVPG